MKKQLLVLASGIIFGFGLALSTMAKPEVVLSFLQLQDYGLLLVLLPAALISGITFHSLANGKRKAPVTQLTYGLRNYPLGINTIIGGVFFGIGWGLSGICPGAAYASLGIGNYPILFGFLGMIIGSYAYHYFAYKFPTNKIVQAHDA